MVAGLQPTSSGGTNSNFPVVYLRTAAIQLHTENIKNPAIQCHITKLAISLTRAKASTRAESVGRKNVLLRLHVGTLASIWESCIFPCPRLWRWQTPRGRGVVITQNDPTMAAVSFISCINGESPSAEKVSEGSSGLTIRKLCGAGQAKSLLLPGASAEQRAEVCLASVGEHSKTCWDGCCCVHRVTHGKTRIHLGCSRAPLIRLAGTLPDVLKIEQQ